jgi:hypothetical protein
MNPVPAPDWTVQRVLNEYPDTARIFIQMKTDCIGCLLARFCTVREVEQDFHLAPGDLLNPLLEFFSSHVPRRDP